MERFLGLVLAAALLLSACKIERTPREYYSHRTPAEAERRLAEEELRARVTAFGQSLDRGELGGALLALAPAPDVYLVGPGEEAPVSGAEGVAGVLREVLGEALPAVRVHDVRVVLEPRARVAWFSALLETERAEPDGGGERMRLSGVYLRVRGEWRLVQAHLSRPFTPPESPPPGEDSPPDSLAPEDG